MNCYGIYKRDYFGFVYIWYDTKRKMFYVGSHMGDIDDGYVCSSKRLRQVFKRRQETLKRRIVFLLKSNDRSILLKEEKRWLDMIKDDELGKKYYNVVRNAWGLSSEEISAQFKDHWSDQKTKEKHIKSMRKAWTCERKKAHAEKIRAKWKSGTYQTRRNGLTEEGREKIRADTIRRNTERNVSKETRKKMSASAKARCTQEWSEHQAALMRAAKF